MESHGTNRAYRIQCLEKNEKSPENQAYKPVVIVHDKETNIWTVFEGIVCKVDKIAERFKEKQMHRTVRRH